MPTLSAALIVKNEERFLDGCLTSLRDLVDEVVIVDTGSTDRTLDIAQAHNVRIVHHTWNGRFDDARNESFQRCTGDWILYIDADERVQPIDRPTLDQELASPDLLSARVLFAPRLGYTPYREWRLFRRHPRMRFRGAIHETLLPAQHEILAQEGHWHTRDSTLALTHLGYEGDLTHKHHRNLPLLLAEIADDPERIYLWNELGRTHAALGNVDEALQAWDRGLELARASPDDPVASLPFVDVLGWRLEHGVEAAELAVEAIAYFPNNPQIAWLVAREFLRNNRHQEALPLLERLVETKVPYATGSEIAFEERLFGLYAYESLGLCYFRLGRFADSAHWYARAAEQAPERDDLRVKAVFARTRAS